MTNSYFLITHGSRSPQSALSLAKMKIAVQQLLADTKVEVGGGCLEGMPNSLTAQMQEFSLSIGAKSSQIIAIPLFLLRGVHTQIDIPNALAQLGDDRWQLAPSLGEHPGIANLLDQHFQKYQQNIPQIAVKVLIAHGSSLSGANTTLETIATTIGAKCAYWKHNPKWQDFLSPDQNMHLLPYFLGESSLIDLVHSQIVNYGQVKFLTSPFTPKVIGYLVKEMNNRFTISSKNY